MRTSSSIRPRLLSKAAVAELTSVSIKTVSRWIANEGLRSHKLGRQVRVSEEDLASFIAVHRR